MGTASKKKSPTGVDPYKTWVYGGLRVRDGHAVTMCAPSRNSLGYQDFLALLEADNPTGQIIVITDNLPHTPQCPHATG